MPVPPVNDKRCQDFTLFPKLPIELRRNIWREGLLQRESVVEVHVFPKSKSWHSRHKRTHDEIKPATPTHPILLGVCRESREEALVILDYVSLMQGSEKEICVYFNPTTDIFYVNFGFCQMCHVRNEPGCPLHTRYCFPIWKILQVLEKNLSSKDLSKINHLAMDHIGYHAHIAGWAIERFADDIVRLPSLKTLKTVLRPASLTKPRLHIAERFAEPTLLIKNDEQDCAAKQMVEFFAKTRQKSAKWIEPEPKMAWLEETS